MVGTSGSFIFCVPNLRKRHQVAAILNSGQQLETLKYCGDSELDMLEAIVNPPPAELHEVRIYTQMEISRMDLENDIGEIKDFWLK
jgi:hypothetical protein